MHSLIPIKQNKRSLVAVALLFQLSPTSSAIAAQLEEVVVTAQKRESNLQETPIAISAFSASALKEIGVTNFTDISDSTPNLTVSPIPGQNGTIVSIRGISGADPSSAIDPKVGTYVDGVYIARNTGNIFELDIERIEVLRGPQGTLWGKNTTGGSINLTTAKPSGELGFSQDLTVGDYGYLNSRTRLDSPSLDLGSLGSLSGRLTLMRKEYDGWQKSANQNQYPLPKRLGEIESDYARIALQWSLGDFHADYSYEKMDRDGTAHQSQLIGADPAFGVDQYIFRDRQDRFDLNSAGRDGTDGDGQNLTLSWEMGNITVKSITGSRHTGVHYQPDHDGNPLVSTGFLVYGLASSYTGGMYDFKGERNHKQFSEEIQVIGSAMDSRLDFTAGLYYFTEESDEDTDSAIYRSSGIFIDLSKAYDIENTSRAAYGQLSYTPDFDNSRWTFTAGARYSEDEKEATKTIHNGVPIDPALYGNKDWDNISLAATVEYSLSDDVNTYLRIAQGYNAGVFNTRSSQEETFSNPADEETLITYELGLKAELLDRRLRINAATFASEYDDLQQQVYINGVESLATNVGKADFLGIELETTYIVTDTISLGFNLAHLDYNMSGYIVDGVDVSGQSTLGFSPKKSGGAFVRYERPVGELGLLGIKFDVAYKGDTAFTAIDYKDVMASSYSIVNGRISLSEINIGPSEMSVALWGKNLADKEYRVFGVNFGEFQTGVFGAPRSFGVDFTLDL